MQPKPVPSQVSRFPPRFRILLVLLGLVAAFTLARYLVLAPLGYPPSSDAGGDLTWLHTYLGHPVPGMDLSQLQPPVYFFAVVAPFGLLFGPFGGAQLTMAVVPSLLVLPGYWLARAGDADRPTSVVIAALLGSAGALSLMVTWNSGYNSFALLLLTAYYAALLAHLKRPTDKRAILAGILIGLLAGTHPLTFLFAVVSTGLVSLGYLAMRRPRRAAARAVGRVIGYGALASMPFVSILYANVTTSTGVGTPLPGSAARALLHTYAGFPALAWGFQGDLPPPTLVGGVYAALIALGLAVLVLVWSDRAHRLLALLTASVVGTALLLGPLDPGNAVRLGYFMPIAVMPALVALVPSFRSLLSSAYGRPAPPSAPAVRETLASRPFRLPLAAMGAGALAVLLVGSAATLSLSEMEQSSRFYLTLNEDTVRALNWLRDNTPATAGIYDGANLNSWIPGYAGRLGFSPGNLQNEITSQSYQFTLDANLITLGSYVLGDGALYVGENLPGEISSPAVYLRTAGSYLPFLESGPDSTYVTLPNGTGEVPLSSAAFEGVSEGRTGGGAPYLDASFRFVAQNLTVLATVTLDGSVVQEKLTAPGNNLVLPWREDFRIPPSGYFFNYTPFRNVTSASGLANAFDYQGTSFGLGVAPNESVLAESLSSGWGIIDLAPSGATLSVALLGWSWGVSASSEVVVTSSLAAALGISYYVVNSSVNYAVFVRMSVEAGRASPTVVVVFIDGPVTIFRSTTR